MRGHYDAAIDLQRAIADGRLADAREMAAWLENHDDRYDPQGPLARELGWAAQTIVHARNVQEAAGGMARLGRACATCHESYKADVRLAYNQLPPAPSMTLDGQMARHSWAAERLWQGVIAPSELAWSEGADVMASTTIDLTRTTNAKPNEEVVRLADEMRALAASAGRVTDRDVRATIYGETLVTCARCHAIVRARPVVRR